MTDEDPRIGALYGLPLERFVAERDALAKALRAEGDRDGAAAVKKLPKPTQPAWAVNIAVRDDPAAAEALADAARALQEAQEELLAGGDPSVLRAAGERARGAVDALVAAAPEGSDATAEKVRATLTAATVDPEVLDEVVAGRVVRERVASGFGGLAGGAAAAPARPARSRDRARSAKPASRGRRRPRTEGDDGAKERRTGAAAADKERERAEARRRQKLEKARAEEAEAEQAVEAARRALEQVERALDERRAQVRDAQAEAREARRRRERAERGVG